jgi:hypothetical protein
MIGLGMNPTQTGVNPGPEPGGVGDVLFYLADPPCYPLPGNTNFIQMLLQPGAPLPNNQETIVATLNQPVGDDNFGWIYVTTDPIGKSPQYQHFIQIGTEGEFLITTVGGHHSDQSTLQNPMPNGCHGDINVIYNQGPHSARRIIWSFRPND